MRETLASISRLAMLAFLLTSMLGVGLSLTLRQIVTPLRNMRLLVAALLANFVVVPLIAVGIARCFHLPGPFAIGLLLLGLAPGAPFLPKLVEWTHGDLAYSVGLMVLLMFGSVAYLPIVLPGVLSGVTVSVWQIARPLLLLMFLPLIAGLVFNACCEHGAARLRPFFKGAANLSLLVVSVLVVGLNLPAVVRVFGTGAIAAAALFLMLAGLAGYFLGGPGLATRKVTALGTSFRNLAAALVVGEEDFRDPCVLVMPVIAALLGLILFFITKGWLSKGGSIEHCSALQSAAKGTR